MDHNTHKYAECCGTCKYCRIIFSIPKDLYGVTVCTRNEEEIPTSEAMICAVYLKDEAWLDD